MPVYRSHRGFYRTTSVPGRFTPQTLFFLSKIAGLLPRFWLRQEAFLIRMKLSI